MQPFKNNNHTKSLEEEECPFLQRCDRPEDDNNEVESSNPKLVDEYSSLNKHDSTSTFLNRNASEEFESIENRLPPVLFPEIPVEEKPSCSKSPRIILERLDVSKLANTYSCFTSNINISSSVSTGKVTNGKKTQRQEDSTTTKNVCVEENTKSSNSKTYADILFSNCPNIKNLIPNNPELIKLTYPVQIQLCDIFKCSRHKFDIQDFSYARYDLDCDLRSKSTKRLNKPKISFCLGVLTADPSLRNLNKNLAERRLSHIRSIRMKSKRYREKKKLQKNMQNNK